MQQQGSNPCGMHSSHSLLHQLLPTQSEIVTMTQVCTMHRVQLYPKILYVSIANSHEFMFWISDTSTKLLILTVIHIGQLVVIQLQLKHPGVQQCYYTIHCSSIMSVSLIKWARDENGNSACYFGDLQSWRNDESYRAKHFSQSIKL